MTEPTKEISDQGQEMIDAKNENRKPFCINCKHEIQEISEHQHEYITWKWDEKAKQFFQEKQGYGGDSDDPKHVCHVKGCDCDYTQAELRDDDSGANIGVSY